MSERAADEVRREAFQAAAAAVDRFLERVGDPVPDELSRLGSAAWDRLRSELGRVVDLNLEVVRDAFGLYGSLLGTESFQPERAGGQLVLGPGTPGSEAAGVLWLHNFDDVRIAQVDLVGSRLVTGNGDTIEQPGWSFTPASPSVPARAATPVLVKVPIPAGLTSGVYRGAITTSDSHAGPIEVLVEVTAMEPIPHDAW